MSTDIDTAAVTSSEPDDRPWHRRSPLWRHEAEIRRMQSEGYSLSQIIRRLGLGVSRPYLWRFLRRAAAAPALGAPAATPAAPGADEADDAAVEALLAATDFSPPSRK